MKTRFLGGRVFLRGGREGRFIILQNATPACAQELTGGWTQKDAEALRSKALNNKIRCLYCHFI